MPFVCVQPAVISWSRRAEELTFDKIDEKDAVLIARLTARLRCYVPEPVDEIWAASRLTDTWCASPLDVPPAAAESAWRWARVTSCRDAIRLVHELRPRLVLNASEILGADEDRTLDLDLELGRNFSPPARGIQRRGGRRYNCRSRDGETRI
jgi:hypothetical protein